MGCIPLSAVIGRYDAASLATPKQEPRRNRRGIARGRSHALTYQRTIIGACINVNREKNDSKKY